MNKFRKLAMTIGVIAITLLAACAQPTEGANRMTICHATGSETNPYEEITISGNAMEGHEGHEDDLIPAPTGGCPTTSSMTGTPAVDTTMTITLTTDTPDIGSPTASTPGVGTGTPGIPVTGELTVCHFAGDATTPYQEIAVASEEEMDEHRAHEGDINPAPLTGCPTYPIVIADDGTFAFCHTDDGITFEEVMVMADGLMNVDGLEDHSDHPNDVFPASEGAGCP